MACPKKKFIASADCGSDAMLIVWNTENGQVRYMQHCFHLEVTGLCGMRHKCDIPFPSENSGIFKWFFVREVSQYFPDSSAES